MAHYSCCVRIDRLRSGGAGPHRHATGPTTRARTRRASPIPCSFTQRLVSDGSDPELPPVTLGRSKAKAPKKKWSLPGRPPSPKKDDQDDKVGPDDAD